MLETQIYQNSWNLSVKTPKSMLVIHFSYLYKLYWRFMMNVNYRQQTAPHLGFYSFSIKGWITQNITLGQVINIKPLLVMHALRDSKVSTLKHWAVQEWNRLKQITIFLQSSQLEKHFWIFENKTWLTFSFCSTL